VGAIGHTKGVVEGRAEGVIIGEGWVLGEKVKVEYEVVMAGG